MLNLVSRELRWRILPKFVLIHINLEIIIRVVVPITNVIDFVIRIMNAR